MLLSNYTIMFKDAIVLVMYTAITAAFSDTVGHAEHQTSNDTSSSNDG